jgi:hypothetical protein
MASHTRPMASHTRPERRTPARWWQDISGYSGDGTAALVLAAVPASSSPLNPLPASGQARCLRQSPPDSRKLPRESDPLWGKLSARGIPRFARQPTTPFPLIPRADKHTPPEGVSRAVFCPAGGRKGRSPRNAKPPAGVQRGHPLACEATVRGLCSQSRSRLGA